MFYQVGVKANDGNGAVSVSVTPRKSLCDGKFHEVTGRTSCIKNIQERESHVDSCAFKSLLLLLFLSLQKKERIPTSGWLRVQGESRPQIHVIFNGPGIASHWG